MERIRIGNDIAISWALFENNGATHLINAGGASVSLNCGGYTYLVPSFSVQGNVVSFIFPAEDQVKTGKYKIVLTERNESGLVSSYDVRDAFVLVPENEMLNVGYTQQKNVEITSVITHAAIANIKTISIVESEEEGGDNVVTFVLTDGSQFPMTVKNGSKGDKGDKGDQGIQGEKGDKGDTGARGSAGIDSVEAAIGTNDPTQAPSVDEELTEGVLSLTFNNIKGEKGDQGEPAVAVDNYVTVEATSSTTSATDVLPATGSADTVYRVSNWDGTQYDDTAYTEYGWYNGAYKQLATRTPGIDDAPIANSQNLVKSGGVAAQISQLGQGVSNAIGKLLGERSVSLIGNNSNWAILPQENRNIVLKKNIQHTITLVSNEEIVVPSGVSEDSRTMLIQVLSTVSDNSLWSKGFNAPKHANNGDVFIVPPLNEDGYLYVEGRWNNTTTIDFIVNEDLFEYNIYTFGNVVADNINHKLQIPAFNIVKGGNSPQSIGGVSIDYSSFPITQTTGWLICLKADNTLEYKPYYNIKSGDIILVSITSITLGSSIYINHLTSPYFNTIISDKNSHFFKDEYLHYELSYSGIFVEKGKIEIKNPSLIIREEQHVNINLLTDVSYPSTGFTINGNKLTIKYVGNGYPTLFYNLATKQVTARNDYHYPPADGTLCLLKIGNDGLYYGILATQLISIKENEICDILGVAPIIAAKTVVVGTIWNGTLIPSDFVCLSSDNYISVRGGSIIYTPHASDLTLRINQYNADKQVIGTSGQASYSDIQAFTLNNNTAFIRIGANYSSRGYSAQNPITTDAYQEGDFDVVFVDSKVLKEFKETDAAHNSRITTVEENIKVIDRSFEKNVYNDVTKSGQGTTWLFYDFYVSKACPNTITFLNDATNGSTGVNYLIYCDNVQVFNGQTGANIKEGTTHRFNSGYSHIQVQCRIASGESLSIRCTQDSIPEEIEELQSPGVIARNAYQEPAIRCAGKKSVDSDLKPFAFMHISDTHVKTGSANYYKCLENARKVMDYYTNLKCCIITGDIVYDTFADPMMPYDVALGYSDKLYLNVIGNHDAGQENQTIGYLASVGTDEQVYNKFMAPYKDKWDLGNGDTGKNYYYKDFTEEKIRLIILYDFETDFELNEEGTRLKYWREACCVRQAQVDWLISTLESTPSDYGVIVAHHINYQYDSSDNNFTTPRLRNKTQYEYQYSSDKQWLEKILTAYQNKSSINITWNQTGGVVTSLTANHDFSNAEGEFICILAGHTHDDFIGHPANFQNLVLLTVGSDNLHYTGRSCARAYNHLSEDLINIVNIERNQKTITVVRVGANFSVTGQRRDSITLSYNIGNN